LGCASTPVQITETDPFDAAHRRIEARSHLALVEQAHTLLQSSQIDPEDLLSVGDQLRQVLMESRVSKSGIQPKLRHQMENALAWISHRMSMHPATTAHTSEPIGDSPHDAVQFSWPMKRFEVASPFGLRTDPFGSEKQLFHDGVDLAAPAGTMIYSPSSGYVVQAGWRDNGCGLGITLMHHETLVSDYCHLSTVVVVKGQRVKTGELIGTVGNTGRSLGAHLHWSVWRDGRAIDPVSMIPKSQN